MQVLLIKSSNILILSTGPVIGRDINRPEIINCHDILARATACKAKPVLTTGRWSLCPGGASIKWRIDIPLLHKWTNELLVNTLQNSSMKSFPLTDSPQIYQNDNENMANFKVIERSLWMMTSWNHRLSIKDGKVLAIDKVSKAMWCLRERQLQI